MRLNGTRPATVKSVVGATCLWMLPFVLSHAQPNEEIGSNELKGLLKNDPDAIIKNALQRTSQDPANIEPVESFIVLDRLLANSPISGRNFWLSTIPTTERLDSVSVPITDRLVINELISRQRSTYKTSKQSRPKLNDFTQVMLANIVSRNLKELIAISNINEAERSLRLIDQLSITEKSRLLGQAIDKRILLSLSGMNRHDLSKQLDRARLDREYQRAKIIAQQLLERDPKDTSTRRTLIDSLLAIDENRLARNHQITLEAIGEPKQEQPAEQSQRPSPVVAGGRSEINEQRENTSDRIINEQEYESRLDYLADLIFSNPTDLALNLEYLKAQTADGDLEGAEVTLERILLNDPTSKYAKILLIETQIKLGKLVSARSNLGILLQDDTLDPAMRSKAESYFSQVDDTLNPTTWSHAISLTAGRSTNALGRPKSGQVLFRDEVGQTLQSKESSNYSELSVETTATYQMPYETPTQLSVTGFGSGRTNSHADLSSTASFGASISAKRVYENSILDTSISAVQARVDNEVYADFTSLAATLMTGLAENLVLGSTATYTQNNYREFQSIADNTSNSGDSIQLGLSLSGQHKTLEWSIGARSTNTEAKSDTAAADVSSLSLALNYKFDNCNNALGTNRSWSEAKGANLFVSSQKKELRTTEWSYSGACVVEDFLYGASIQPNFQFVHRNVDSNIPNYANQSNQFSIGVRMNY